MQNVQHINDDEELRKTAPLLYGIPKENSFSVPEHYFDSLSSVIQQRCIDESKSRSIQIFSLREIPSLQFFIKPKYALAFASLLLIAAFGISKFFFLKEDFSNTKFTAEQMVNTGFAQTLDEGVLTEALADNGYFDEEKNDEVQSSDNEQIEDYLIKNKVDVNFIINEL